VGFSPPASVILGLPKGRPFSDFKWSEDNLACMATYKVLEDDKFLDQFEDADLPFKAAKDKKLGELRYFPFQKTHVQPSATLSFVQPRR
jgi:hypothetical protein